MDVVHPRVAGIDVHKKQVTVAVRLPGQGPGERTVTVRTFRTFWRQLVKMAGWLAGLGVSDAAMESTGVYWWPAWHALVQAGIDVCVCNAAHMHNVPGRKTDARDSEWIAELHEYGLLRPSFIPTGLVADLRTRTRYRKRLIEARTSEGQRLAKVLEDAGIRIDSVASELLGVSGRAMIEALIAGERDPGRLADLARGVLRRKTGELQLACDGRFTAVHAQMCRLHLDAYDHLTGKIAELDVLVAEAAEPFGRLIAKLMTIPGIGRRTAEVIVAETGGDMSRFPAPAQLAAWCGLAPGNRESAGKRMRAGTRKGNKHLKAALVESAWSVARTRTRPGARFRRLARRFGKGNQKKAAVAVARTLLGIAWAVMRYDGDYAEAGEDFYDRGDQRHREPASATPDHRPTAKGRLRRRCRARAEAQSFLKFPHRERRLRADKVPAGLGGALPLGMVFGLGWTPCIGPTLGAVLGLAAVGGGGVGRGAILLFAYSLGLGVPFLIGALGFRSAVGASPPCADASGCSRWREEECYSSSGCCS